LFASDFTRNSDGWKKLGNGEWSVQDGALKQTAEREFVRALAGDRSWTDYTLELKARKLSGREGFLILFQIQDDEDRTWWNLGGWENTRHGVELGETLDGKPGRIETGRWYDIKVEVRGKAVTCSLDGRVVHNLPNARQTLPDLFASATRDEKTGDLIVKVVNSSAGPAETEIELSGAGALSGKAQAIVLTSASPKDENSLAEPMKVSPRTEPFTVNGSKVVRTLPGNSFTVLRIPSAK
jgi:alpha-L-arabinofuranosidase